ncbi:MAG: plasmid mobilization protein [Sulfuriferula sp.]
MEQQNKTSQFKTRITEAQHEHLLQQAQKADMTLSELIRRSVMNRPVVSRADAEAANSIDKIGRMLKHSYPKDQAWASDEDRRKWWRLAEDLLEMARDIQYGRCL